MSCREIGIFDVRRTLTVPVVEFPKDLKAIYGAYFSPITSQYALATCADDTLKLYNVQKSNTKSICK